MRRGENLAMACVLVALFACGSRTTAGGEGEGEGTGNDGSTGDDGDDGTGGDGGDGGTTGGGDDGTTGDDGGTTEDTGGTEDGCPPREAMSAWVSVDMPLPEEPFSAECLIHSVSENGDETTLSLSCEGPPPQSISLTVTAEPPVVAAHLEGLTVGFEYAVNMPFWMEQWVVMQTFDPPTTQLLIVDGPTLDPPTGALEHPGIELAEVNGVCALVPGECATEERLAIDVTSAGDSQRMFDGSLATVGRHDVLVPYAHVNHPPINCTDLPSRWISVVAVGGG